MMNRFVVIASVASLLFPIAPAAGQPNPATPARGSAPLVAGYSIQGSGISLPQFYTQPQVSMQGFTIGAGEDQRSLGKAILAAFGQKQARSITASIVISTPNVTYPEIPVLSFQFGDDRKISVSEINTRTLPLQRLDANGIYTVALKYRYSNQVGFDVQTATTNLSNLLPSSIIQFTPFLGNVVNMAANIFSISQSQDTSYALATEVSPFIGRNNLAYFDVRKPDGTWFGRITVALLATPTLMRVAQPVSSITNTIPAKSSAEDPTTLSVSVGGASHYLISDVKALDQYSKAVKARDETTVRDFCGTAKSKLSTDIALTPMDRVLLTYATMTGAGFDPNDGSWFAWCFDSPDQSVLAQVAGIHAPTVTPPGSGMPGVTKEVKYALGCFITGQSGTECAQNAPHPEDVLRVAFTDRVKMGILDLSGIVDPASLPADRTLARGDFLTALRGKAGGFGCFAKGLLLLSADRTHAYSFDTTSASGKIQSASIRSIPVEAFQCTD